MSQKFDLPDLYVSEYKKFDELKMLGNTRTTTGTISFTSTSSNATYNSTTGQLGLLQQLETLLNNYKINASDWNDVTKHVDIQTTQGKSFSTSNTVTKSGNNIIKEKPLTTSKKVVFYGSSTFGGAWATNGNGCIQQYMTALTSLGWTCYNCSEGGIKTQDGIDRFYTDVVPFNPDIVVFGFTLHNEGITSNDNNTVYDTYMVNMKKLVSMAKQQGIVPVIVGAFMNNAYDASDYIFAKMWNREIDTWVVPAINLMSSLDDLNGHYLSGTYYDALHANDTGYLAEYLNFSLTFFDNVMSKGYPLNPKCGTYFAKLLTDTSTQKPIEAVLDSTFNSFTYFFEFQNVSATVSTNNTLASFTSTASRVRVNSSTGYIEYVKGDTNTAIITSNVLPITDGLLHKVVVTKNAVNGEVRMWIDGNYIGSGTDTTNIAVSLTIAGRGDATSANGIGYKFRNIALYRGRFTDDQALDLSKGNIIKQNLEIFSTLDNSVFSSGQRLVNLALTNGYLKVNSANLTSVS